MKSSSKSRAGYVGVCTVIQIIKFSVIVTTKRPVMQDWVFRHGLVTNFSITNASLVDSFLGSTIYGSLSPQTYFMNVPQTEELCTTLMMMCCLLPRLVRGNFALSPK